ncbi:MAG: ABC transporter substrate-binding protein [Gemmataceae bacterium]
MCRRGVSLVAVLGLTTGILGCHTTQSQNVCPPVPNDLPKELSKVSFPMYTVEPPDILLVESLTSLPEQQVSGEHLVRPDGTIHLGMYGSVYVAGLTLDEVKKAVERQLSKYVKDPQVVVDVLAYNSKVYYVITDGAGYGEQVFRLPATGNETVLDAISQVGGLPAVASKKRIWIARPSPSDLGCDQILPVDWEAITQGGSTATNYQILPGDRIYVHSDHMIRFDTWVAKMVTPFERMFGFTLLGHGTIQNLRKGGGSSGFGGAGF